MRPLLDAEAIAKLLGVKTGWVYAQARAGRIPHVKLGRLQASMDQSTNPSAGVLAVIVAGADDKPDTA